MSLSESCTVFVEIASIARRVPKRQGWVYGEWNSKLRLQAKTSCSCSSAMEIDTEPRPAESDDDSTEKNTEEWDRHEEKGRERERETELNEIRQIGTTSTRAEMLLTGVVDMWRKTSMATCNRT